ncbi:MAG: M14 family zinc carboxypeptidase [Ilumatobacteraceae bacterium]
MPTLSRPTRRRVIGAALAGFAAAAGGPVFADPLIDRLGGGGSASVTDTADRRSAPARRRWSLEHIGTSVEGRPIEMHTNVDPAMRASVLAISTVHGDERGVGPIGEELTTVTVPPGVSAYVVPIANPDGWARGTRNNARDVDLNRNFPWWWSHRDGGPGRASEPETQALMALVARLRPVVTVWIHQPYEYVSAVDPRAERWARAWADAAGLPLLPAITQHGGGETWTYHELGLASILVEGTTREASIGETSAHRRGFEALLAAL